MAPSSSPPQLDGAHFDITVLAEPGFLDIIDNNDKNSKGDDDATTTTTTTRGSSSSSTPRRESTVTSSTKYYNLTFQGYLIDMIHAIAQPHRANFTYTLKPPSGMGSTCQPQLPLLMAGRQHTDSSNNSKYEYYGNGYRTQYNCGADDVNDMTLRTSNSSSIHSTDMYLGMYYVTPARQLINQFTIPFVPPTSGTLAMFGTATGIPNFEALVEQQQLAAAAGQQPSSSTTTTTTSLITPEQTCGPAGTALIDNVVRSYPGLQIRGIYAGEEDIYQSFVNQSCRVYITDGPIAAQFIKRRHRRNQCVDRDGAPMGVIGQPMEFGLSHYAIGIRQDISPYIVNNISYWMNILMTCNPLDPEGPCPEGNFATFYHDTGGTGAECGYVLYPKQPETSSIFSSKGAMAGIVLAAVVPIVLLVSTLIWHRYRLQRQKRRYAKRSQAALEQATREREFNEYMAHEVRNPLASALAALSFVSSKTADPTIVPDPEHRALIKSDVSVVDSSLQFVNDLLRNMLDLHRTQTGHGIKLHPVPTDILRDILEPVSTILFMRGAAVNIQTECPPNLWILMDRMRLKQILLNLSNNATKFVCQGYIRLRAEVVVLEVNDNDNDVNGNNGNGNCEKENHGTEEKDPEGGGCNGEATATKTTVVLYVEDSGPGIPLEKRRQLFVKFQDSLDVLHQGTGIGLCVCKNLSDLMGCSLSLDEDFDSGIPGCPGTRFRLQLNQPPMNMDNPILVGSSYFQESDEICQSIREELPDQLSVLFVDDDMVLRKMFSRVLHMAAPTWNIREASNGETALCFVEEDNFDLIFVDQYMASVERQLLGTETVQAMRAKGVKSIICGLSANDLEEQFIQAGANAFMVKPFPCKKDLLKDELRKMLLPPPPSTQEQSPPP